MPVDLSIGIFMKETNRELEIVNNSDSSWILILF